MEICVEIKGSVPPQDWQDGQMPRSFPGGGGRAQLELAHA